MHAGPCRISTVMCFIPLSFLIFWFLCTQLFPTGNDYDGSLWLYLLVVMAHMGGNSYNSFITFNGSLWNAVSIWYFLEEQLCSCLPFVLSFPNQYGKFLSCNTSYTMSFHMHLNLILRLLLKKKNWKSSLLYKRNLSNWINKRLSSLESNYIFPNYYSFIW